MKVNRILAVATALLLAVQMPLTALADVTVDVSLGDVSINDTQVSHTVANEGGGTSAKTEDHGGSVTVKQSNSETPTSNTVTVKTEQKDVTVTLDNVNIAVKENGTSDKYDEGDSAMTVNAGAGTTVTVELDGTNKLTGNAGLAKEGKGNLTIQDKSGEEGTMNAKGYCGAGIGGEDGKNTTNITVTGGDVTAESSHGAGIGGGSNGDGREITISGGDVTAESSWGGGIGGGYEGDGREITISGGEVNAESGNNAGIGGGSNGDGRDIIISGGTVTAKGGNGAGIGGGNNGDGRDITISGGVVSAQGKRGAGIGGGYNGDGRDITISGGNVTAKSTGYLSAYYGAGIGGGYKGDGRDITITGGDVKASAVEGAGIGGGSNGDGREITISGGDVVAKSTSTKKSGAGIGGGYQGKGSGVTVSGDAHVDVSSTKGHGIGDGKASASGAASAVEPDISRLYRTGYIQYSDRTVYGTYPPIPEGADDTGESRKTALYTIYNEDRDISATITEAGLKLLEEDLSGESQAALTEGVAADSVLRTCNLSFDKDYSGSITLRFLLGEDCAEKTVEIRTLTNGKTVTRTVTTDKDGTATLGTTTLGDFAVILK